MLNQLVGNFPTSNHNTLFDSYSDWAVIKRWPKTDYQSFTCPNDDIE